MEKKDCRVSSEIIALLVEICGQEYVRTSELEKSVYCKDETMNYIFPFDVLVIPSNVEEISAVLSLCNREGIPVTPRGGGSGVTGGALPVKRGVVLSLERLNKIIEINATDSFAILESGVITETFCRALDKTELFLPVIPTSSFQSFVGGNVAMNSGSVSSCKYGSTGDYILNLEVVLPNGKIFWTGKNVRKNVAGINLTQLFVGSEGSLGIISKVVYKLIKRPKRELNLLLGFKTLEAAYQMVLELKSSNLNPSVVELISEEAIGMAKGYFDEELLLSSPEIKSQLLIQFEGMTDVDIDGYLEPFINIAHRYTTYDIYVAKSNAEKQRVWKIRSNLGAILTSHGQRYRDIDITIPISKIYDYLIELMQISKTYNIKIVRFGHIMDGNLHVMILLNDKEEPSEINNAINEIYSYAISLGGTITGEHGIGILQKEFMSLQFDFEHLEIMRKIKHVFDVNGILNPGKVF